jgi:type IV secretory pathway VirB2 component (pilin)
MTNLLNFLNTIPTWEQGLGTAIAIIMVGVAAIYMMTGQKGGAAAKIMLVYIGGAVAILYMAIEIINTIRSAVGQ